MVLIGRTNKHNFLFPSRVAMSLSFVVSVTIITCSRAQIQVIGIWSRLHGIWSVISNGSRSSVDDSCPLHTPLIIWIQLETMNDASTTHFNKVAIKSLCRHSLDQYNSYFVTASEGIVTCSVHATDSLTNRDRDYKLLRGSQSENN